LQYYVIINVFLYVSNQSVELFLPTFPLQDGKWGGAKMDGAVCAF